MRLLAVSAPARDGGVALPVRRRERGGDPRLASRARGAPPAGEPAKLRPGRSGVPGRTRPAASSGAVGQCVCATGDDPPPAPVASRASLDVSTSAAGQARNRRRRSCADCAAGTRERGFGVTGGSTLNSPVSVCRSRPAPPGRSSGGPASIQHRAADRKRGGSSRAPRPAESLPATSSLSTPCCSDDCTHSCSSSSLPGRCTSPASRRTRQVSGRPSRHVPSSRSSSNAPSRSGF